MSTNTKKPAQKFAVLISHERRHWFVDKIFDDPVLACGCVGENLAAAEAMHFVGWHAEVFELVPRGRFDLSKSESPSGAVSRFSASAGPAGGL